jgi:acetolactate synthase-1/2/3 large subunit
MSGIAKTYGFPYRSCASHAEMAAAIDETMRSDGPAICEVFLNPDQPFAPKAASIKLPDGRIVSRPLEDLSPFLSRKELCDNMLIPLLPE